MKNKHLVSLLLVLTIVSMLASCWTVPVHAAGDASHITVNDNFFPLEEPITITMMGFAKNAEPMDIPFIREYVKATNVNLKYIALGGDVNIAKESLNNMINSGDYGDVIMSNIIVESDVSRLAAAGILPDLTQWVDDPDIMPNLNNRVFSESPATRGIITAPDGGVYALPRFVGIPEDYLESPLWINKKWLDVLELQVPTTLDEFENVLKMFAENDPNGNGLKDEVPWLVFHNDAYASFEAFMGTWGMPTKSNVLDSYTCVRDGKVNFVPTMDSYKDAITFFHKLWSQNLIWSEAFTGTTESFNAKYSELNYGVVQYKSIAADATDDYIPMMPPKADEYDPVWYYHPGSLGIKCFAEVTNKPLQDGRMDIIMSWMDGFYSLPNSMQAYYGLVGDGAIKYVDGKYEYETVPEGMSLQQMIDAAMPSTLAWGFNNYAFMKSDYENGIIPRTAEALKQLSAYVIYKDVLNKEIWPRPFFNEADSERLSELRTDIFNTVSYYKAQWITGERDITADWDEYITKLYQMGLEEYVAILQRGYDKFIVNFEK